MAIYAVGDIQGCHDEFMVLLERIGFSRSRDLLWLTGDIVNRGPQSLECLRFVKDLGDRAVTVLGNHDLHLLAMSQGNLRFEKNNRTLEPILNAPDRDELLHWLRHRPLMHHDARQNYTLVHAGLPAEWDVPTALQRAGEVESVLRGGQFHGFCMEMYGNNPDRWSDDLQGMDRIRCIVNCLTRMRYCGPDGTLDFGEHGAPGSQNPGLVPWFKLPGRASRKARILFGHWSTLGYLQSDNVWALDSGCLWGGQLTAVRLGERSSPEPYQLDCPGFLRPGA